MNPMHKSFDNSASSSRSVLEKLVTVPLECNVLERQMQDESREQRTGVSGNNQTTKNPNNYTRQQYTSSINNERLHSQRHTLHQKYQRPHRRQSLPNHTLHSNSNRKPFMGNFQPGLFDYHHQTALANLNFVRRHSNSPVYPSDKLRGDAHDLRNVPNDKPPSISNVDLESNSDSQGKLESTKAPSIHSKVQKSFTKSEETGKRAVPEVIDLTVSDYKAKKTGANDTRLASSSQHSGKSRMESLSEERDSVFDINNGPLKEIEQKGKQTGLKRAHYSEATGFDDNSYSTANKRLRRASGPDRFPSYPSSFTYGRARETSSSTSLHPSDLPFTLDTLTTEIKSESLKCLQTYDLLSKKQKLRSVLEKIIRVQFPGCVLHLVGSSVNGLANDDSDADFCLMLTQWREIDQRYEARRILMKLNRLLTECNFVEGNQVIFATVPIIKFVDSVSKCECDININNHVGIRNTFLIKAYCKVDPRVVPLVMVVKKWAKNHGINDSKDGTLSSYALTLMVLHYLQYACQPPVIPSLQKKYPDIFSENSDVNLVLLQDIQQVFTDANISKSQNFQSLGELLLGFFQYFADQYNWDADAISVRLGHTYSKSFGKLKNKYIYIEEPFDYNNVAKTVYNEENFLKIKMKIRLAANKLKVSPSLQSIL